MKQLKTKKKKIEREGDIRRQGGIPELADFGPHFWPEFFGTPPAFSQICAQLISNCSLVQTLALSGSSSSETHLLIRKVPVYTRNLTGKNNIVLRMFLSTDKLVQRKRREYMWYEASMPPHLAPLFPLPQTPPWPPPPGPFLCLQHTLSKRAAIIQFM